MVINNSYNIAKYSNESIKLCLHSRDAVHYLRSSFLELTYVNDITNLLQFY